MRIAAGMIFATLLSVLLPTLGVEVSANKDVVNTLFTVLGVIFSVGMSLIISVSTSGIKNKDAKSVVRNQLKRIRQRFITVFGISSLCYVLLPTDSCCMGNLNLPVKMNCYVFMVSVICLGIIYYTVNYYAIQKSVYEIEDRLESERESG